MKTSVYLLAALFVGTATLVGLSRQPAAAQSPISSEANPDLEYLKAVNSVGPPRDQQMLFLLMAEYSSAQRQGEGAEFFSARLKEFGPRLTDTQKALYLSAIGLLRAQHASSVSLLN